ncbi:hypothetical protein SETIT_2G082700v2 [Setaria italica]|uniref:Uncharacterized protein n=1 Tax=Setaria italica TaxID=4555 RepID=A0A368PX20_SETIT|nr:hypothetical protein SETIT_2G082700v2 [Setaria italica]
MAPQPQDAFVMTNARISCALIWQLGIVPGQQERLVCAYGNWCTPNQRWTTAVAAQHFLGPHNGCRIAVCPSGNFVYSLCHSSADVMRLQGRTRGIGTQDVVSFSRVLNVEYSSEANGLAVLVFRHKLGTLQSSS